MCGAVVEITSLEQLEEHQGLKTGYCFVFFYATWSNPCGYIGPFFEKFAKKYAGKCTHVKVDVENLPEAAERHGATIMPTFMVFSNGNKFDELKGASELKLEALIQKYS